MIPFDKIFEIVLVLLSFIFKKVADREAAIKRFREVFKEIEQRNEPSEISNETDRLMDQSRNDQK